MPLHTVQQISAANTTAVAPNTPVVLAFLTAGKYITRIRASNAKVGAGGTTYPNQMRISLGQFGVGPAITLVEYCATDTPIGADHGFTDEFNFGEPGQNGILITAPNSDLFVNSIHTGSIFFSVTITLWPG